VSVKLCHMCGSDLPKGCRRFCSEKCRRDFQKEYNREYAAKRRAEGLCRYCGEPATDGMASCRPCREKYRKRMRRQIAARRRTGLCIRCGRPRKPGYRQCHLCLTYSSMWRSGR